MNVHALGKPLLLPATAMAVLFSLWTTSAVVPGPAEPVVPDPVSGQVSKMIEAALDDHVHMSVTVLLLTGDASIEGAPSKYRPIAVGRVFDYGRIVTDKGTLLGMVDVTGSEAIRFSGGAADPNEAAHLAKQLLGLPTTYEQGIVTPLWNVTVEPRQGLTWGDVGTREDISVTWQPAHGDR